MQTLQRKRARDQVRDTIRQTIVAGEFSAGTRLDELGLAARIGSSRTPVREALIALEAEGMVQSRPNHGFVVAPLDEALVRELYPILGALEGAAVEAGGEALRSAVPHLAEINDRLALETNPARRYELDRKFHRALCTPCGNAKLLHLLELHWNQAKRVDGGTTRGLANPEGSCAEHAGIVAALAAGEPARAASLVRHHWHTGQDVVLRWMRDAT
jgi:DNA-binding GntR family transcriptional regulator